MTKSLWQSHVMEVATGGKATEPFSCNGLSIDTRSLEQGDMFIALSDNRDGHDFIHDAEKAGASATLVSRICSDIPSLLVSDVNLALVKLGKFARERAKAERIAVTGSVGKTSLKEMIARIFRGAGTAHWSDKSFNNHYGVPLTLARMPKDTERAVFEIGTSSVGEISERSKLVQPHHAVITAIAPAHLEYFDSVEAIADEKADIFLGLEDEGTIILPINDKYKERMASRAVEHCPSGVLATFGTKQDADSVVKGYETDGITSLVEIEVDQTNVKLSLNLVGEHWAVNAAASLLVAVRSGISPAHAADALSGYTALKGRGAASTLKLPSGGSFTLVDDSYNANPTSMKAAIESLASRTGTRRIAALGEMLEIGTTSDAQHANLLQPLLDAGVSHLVLAGDRMSSLREASQGKIQTEWAKTAEPLFSVVKEMLQDGDILLVKGSNASGMGKLVESLNDWVTE